MFYRSKLFFSIRKQPAYRRNNVTGDNKKASKAYIFHGSVSHFNTCADTPSKLLGKASAMVMGVV